MEAQSGGRGHRPEVRATGEGTRLVVAKRSQVTRVEEAGVHFWQQRCVLTILYLI